MNLYAEVFCCNCYSHLPLSLDWLWILDEFALILLGLTASLQELMKSLGSTRTLGNLPFWGIPSQLAPWPETEAFYSSFKTYAPFIQIHFL